MIETEGKTIVKVSLFIIIFTVIAGYSYYQARAIIHGPEINITSPKPASTLDSPLVEIKGNAKNVSFITLNDRQIYVDNEGNFKEELLLSPGYNTWEIEAKDKFGRVVSKKIELVLRKDL